VTRHYAVAHYLRQSTAQLFLIHGLVSGTKANIAPSMNTRAARTSAPAARHPPVRELNKEICLKIAPIPLFAWHMVPVLAWTAIAAAAGASAVTSAAHSRRAS
jgi:hypothetical protein